MGISLDEVKLAVKIHLFHWTIDYQIR